MANRPRSLPTDGFERVANDAGWFAQTQKWVFLEAAKLGSRGANLTHVYAYLWMRSHSDEHSVCFPSHATIAKDTGLSVSTVQRSLSSLIEIGAVSVRRTRTSNTYRIHVMPPRGIDTKPRWPSEVGQIDRSSSVKSTDHDRSDRPMNKKQRSRYREEELVRAPGGARKTTEGEVSDGEYLDDESRRRRAPKKGNREPGTPVSGSPNIQRGSDMAPENEKYIRRRKTAGGSMGCAMRFRNQVEMRQPTWCSELTQTGDSPSKTNLPALAKQFTAWRKQHGWNDEQCYEIIETFLAMVEDRKIVVKDRATRAPWTIFVGAIDRVVEAHTKVQPLLDRKTSAIKL